jgi:competence protein ComEA
MGSTGERGKGQLLAFVAAAVLVAVAGFRYLGGADDQPAPAPVEIDDPASEAEATNDGSDSARLHVHVAGAVREEGLYSMPSGARVGAAIDRAGGPTAGAELAGVNLAAEVQDGQQVVVPRRGEVPAPSATGATGSALTGTATGVAGAEGAPISLAQATPEQLDASVEGIGPVLAAAIIEYRDENGSVHSIDQLQEVDGIGEERLATLREALVP